MSKGIDVSEFQPNIDWAKVRTAGIEFAMLRAGYGNNHIDGEFIRNATGCTASGIPFGVYWFSYALTADDAAREAAQCIASVKPYNVAYPIAYDLEYDSVTYAKKNGVTMDKTLATACAKAFCEAVKAAGYTPAVYMNCDYSKNMFDLSQLPCDIWYAYYQPEPDRTGISIWQCANNGSVDGISGRVDMDISYKDYGAAVSAAPAATTETSASVSAPDYPLPSGYYFGPKSGPVCSVSGYYSHREDLRTWQQRMADRGWTIDADGLYGDQTADVARKFQSEKGLEVDGKIGPQTWAAAWTEPIT